MNKDEFWRALTIPPNDQRTCSNCIKKNGLECFIQDLDMAHWPENKYCSRGLHLDNSVDKWEWNGE